MNELIFQKLKSTVDGVGATTGKQTEKAFNDNFELVKTLFTEVLSALAITVTSGELKQIKVDTSTTPYTLYYTLDDESVLNPTWYKLLQFGFSQLTGSPYDNINLKTVLDTKTDRSTTESIALQITGINTDIFNINTEISGLKNEDSDLHDEITRLDNEDQKIYTSIQNLKLNELANLTKEDARLQSEIDALELATGQTAADMSRVVFTEQGATLWMKYDIGAGELQASTDLGATWLPIGAVSLQWKQLTGRPEDATSLVSLIDSKLSKALQNYVDLSALLAHTADTNNPHKVTADQLGLGHVLELVQNLEASDNEILRANADSWYRNKNMIANKAYFLSSHFGRATLLIEGDDYYEPVKTIASGESYIGPDSFTINHEVFEDPTADIPAYYKVYTNNADTSKLDILFNQDLYNYISSGGVLE